MNANLQKLLKLREAAAKKADIEKKEQIARRAEAERIHNLPENVEKRRVEAERNMIIEAEFHKNIRNGMDRIEAVRLSMNAKLGLS